MNFNKLRSLTEDLKEIAKVLKLLFNPDWYIDIFYAFDEGLKIL